jgi:hypothetical protein
MSDQIDISREACERSAQALHELAEPFGKPCAEGLMITALRAALDAAEAEKARAVEALILKPEGWEPDSPQAAYERGWNAALAAIRTGAKP